MSLGSGAAVAIQAVLSWWIMDVEATACPSNDSFSCRLLTAEKDVYYMGTWLLQHGLRNSEEGL